MDNIWDDFITEEMKKPYMQELVSFVKERRTKANVLPEPCNLFLAFKLTEWHNIKVVIIGHEPSPTAADSHGLAFSSLAKETPYSLQNIFNEVLNDIYESNSRGVKIFQTNNLTAWAKQGVLLLNSVWTTEENTPGAHKDKGWETFTANTVKFINTNHTSRIAWMLWGKPAKDLKKHINIDKHLVLESEHPAALRNNPLAFTGNRHFSKANNFIKKHYFNHKSPINWHLIP